MISTAVTSTTGTNRKRRNSHANQAATRVSGQTETAHSNAGHWCSLRSIHAAAWLQYNAARVTQIARATRMGHTMSHSILGCSRLPNPFSSAAKTLSIRLSPPGSLPYLREPLDRDGHRRPQLLREELHTQLLEHPPELFQASIGLSGFRLLLLLAPPLRLERCELRGEPRVAPRVGTQLVQPQRRRLEITGEVLEPLVRRLLDEPVGEHAGDALLNVAAWLRKSLGHLLQLFLQCCVLRKYSPDDAGDLLGEQRDPRSRLVATLLEFGARARPGILQARPVEGGGEQLRAQFVGAAERGELHRHGLHARKVLFDVTRLLPELQHEERSEEHTSELQSHVNLVCRLLLEKKKKNPQGQPLPCKLSSTLPSSEPSCVP